MKKEVDTGYLVLADISGFTSFVAGTELEHSKIILGEIFGVITNSFVPALEIAEIEGDAVFAFARDEKIQRGEFLLEIIEATYAKFRMMKASAERSTTCDCRACKQSAQLDLKFIAHHGEFALQEMTGKMKPLGSSVNLLHRLSKNRVQDKTGWHGYALFTDPTLKKMDLHPENGLWLTEQYEHLGDITTFSVNLDNRYKEIVEQQRVFIDPENAHVIIEREYPVAPPLLWDWLNDPEKRDRWGVNNDWKADRRPEGRLMRGATNHCSKTGFLEMILDWRPFSYFTVEVSRGPVHMQATSELQPTETGTRLSWRARLQGKFPRWILRPMCIGLVAIGARAKPSYALLSRILHDEHQMVRS